MAHIPNTDIWYRTFIVPKDTLSQYKIAPDVPKVTEGGFAQRKAILATAQADPFNAHGIPSFATDRYNRFSLLSLAPEKRQCDFAKIEGHQRKGRLESFNFHSNLLNNDRQIYLYRPAVAMSKPSVLVLLDGQTYLHTYKMADFLISGCRRAQYHQCMWCSLIALAPSAATSSYHQILIFRRCCQKS